MCRDLGTKAWVDEVIAKGHVTALDVTRLSSEVCPMGLTDLGDVDALFQVERSVLDKHPSWPAVFTSLVCDHLVWGERPTGVIESDRAQWVLTRAARTGTQAAEDLLSQLVSEADDAPAWFVKAVEKRGCAKASQPIIAIVENAESRAA